MWWTSSPKQSIESLVKEHYEALYRYAYRLCGNSSEAEDLTQETFCKAQRNLSQLRDMDKAKSWLYTILRNVFLLRRRSEKNENKISLDSLEEIPERSPAPLPEIESEHLQNTLKEMPEAFRLPIVLYYFEELSYREIAEQLNLPLGTVMSRLARGKGILKEKLGAFLKNGQTEN